MDIETTEINITNISDILSYDYCPVYFYSTHKEPNGIEKVMRAIISRYWLERSADAQPTYKVLLPLVENIFNKGGIPLTTGTKNYIRKVLGHSGRIPFTKVVVIAPIFTITTASGIVVQVSPDVVIFNRDEEHHKAIIYPNTRVADPNEKFPNYLFTKTSTLANSCFLTTELPIRTVLLVYPDKVVRLKKHQRHAKEVGIRIEHAANGMHNQRLFYKTGGWCHTCPMFGQKGTCK